MAHTFTREEKVRGGKACLVTMTPEERQARARAAIAARYKKRAKKPASKGKAA